MGSETVKQREAREAAEAQEAATQAELVKIAELPAAQRAAFDEAFAPAASPEVNAEPAHVGPAPTEPTLAETRRAAGNVVASAEAKFYAGLATQAEVDAARAAWAATRRH